MLSGSLRCVLLALALSSCSALATREPTAAPVYYLIDYGREHLDNPEYVEWVRELPPDQLLPKPRTGSLTMPET